MNYKRMANKSTKTPKQTISPDISTISKPSKDRITELTKKIQILEKLESESQCQDCLILGSCPFHSGCEDKNL
jgi:hypothetical protein